MSKNETLKPLVMRCMIMRLDEKESLAYVNDQGYELSRVQYYRVKKKIKDSKFERLSQIAKGFVDHHLERMDTLDLVNYEMWRKYRQGDYKALDALSKIAETQTILSQYYDVSKMVMENEIERINRKEVGKPRKVTINEDGELYWDDESEGMPPIV
jgi:hypothetical protein